LGSITGPAYHRSANVLAARSSGFHPDCAEAPQAGVRPHRCTLAAMCDRGCEPCT